MNSPPKSPMASLPPSPRPDRKLLSPIDENLRCDDITPISTPGTTSSEVFIDSRKRNRESLIFVNATIPLSPAFSATSSVGSRDLPPKELPYQGLAPRKRNPFARLFCCLGREERARRKVLNSMEFEKVGEDCHWTEY